MPASESDDPLYDKAHPKKASKTYRPHHFTYDPQTGTCTCPTGKKLYQNGSNCVHNGRLSNCIEKRRFTVVNVTHYGNDRWSKNEH